MGFVVNYIPVTVAVVNSIFEPFTGPVTPCNRPVDVNHI